MAKFVTPLQEEIVRLARKEVLKMEKPIKATLRTLRAENTALKSKLKAMEKVGALCAKAAEEEKQKQLAPTQEEMETIKFTPNSIVRLRKKHGLSRLKMAELLKINHKSIARWEQGAGIPQSESKAKLITFKKMSKGDVKKAVKELAAAPAAPAKKAPAKKAVAKKAVAKKKTAKKRTARKK
jgi:histone H1/5